MTGALARLVAAHPGSTVVAVSHADPIKTAVAHALGTHLDLFQRIAVFTASVTAIAYGPSGPTVLAGDRRQRLAADDLQVGPHPHDGPLHARDVLVDLPTVVTAEDDVETGYAGSARVSRHRWFSPELTPCT